MSRFASRGLTAMIIGAATCSFRRALLCGCFFFEWKLSPAHKGSNTPSSEVSARPCSCCLHRSTRHYVCRHLSAECCVEAKNYFSEEEVMTFRELLGNVGLFGGAVMVCLVALSFFSLAVIVEKHRRFRTAMRQSQMFKQVFKNFLRGGEIQQVIDALPKYQNSH